MIRKILHSNITCLVLTGLLWVITLLVRFLLLGQQIPSGDWILWVACNNAMIAGFSYQLGIIACTRRADERKRKRLALHRRQRDCREIRQLSA